MITSYIITVKSTSE